MIFTYLAFFLFLIGVIGFLLTRKHLILMLMSLELMFLAVNYNFLFGSVFLDDLCGQIYGLALLAVAAAEAAIGLALIVVFYKLQGSIAIDAINKLNSYYIKK